MSAGSTSNSDKDLNQLLPTTLIKSSKLMCTICNKHFQWKSGLSRHYKLFHLQNKDKNYKCDICNQLFHKQVGLSMHLKQHTCKIMPLMKEGINNLTENCEISASENKKISYLYTNVVTETVYSSDSDCEYEILQTATKVNNTDDKFKHRCRFCEKRFVKSNSLQRHLKKHNHGRTQDDKQGNGRADKEGSAAKQEPSGNKRSFSCNKCNKTFKLGCNLSNHLKLHLKQSIVARKEFSLLEIKARFSCLFCNKIYSKKNHLQNHLAIHRSNDGGSKDEKWPCPDCKEEFGKKALEIHKQTHALTKPYLCMVCGKSYSRSGYLSLHMRTHSNYRPHLCSVCGKSFTIKRYLIVHSRTHNQDRPFTCQHCNKGFIQKGNLIEHLRIHSGIKPHICAVCGKQFTHYSGLTQHLLIHNAVKRHTCKICGKAFRQGGHYREHMRIHSGDRPFVCNHCSRGFANNSSLVVHLRTHSGERPFKCSVCKKGFIKSYGLKQHKKTHSACNVLDNVT